MRPERVHEIVGGIPHMNPGRGSEIWDFLIETQPQRMLELGTAHGVSACYMAAAAEEFGGVVTTMDRKAAADLSPSVYDLLQELRLENHVEIVMADRSFTWELMKLLRDDAGSLFDFCFFDGGHSWDVTGFAFFLVDRLLNPGSWVLFDDLEWSFDSSPSLRETRMVKDMPADEREARQVSLVFDLLVVGDPRYVEIRRDGNWGWAKKSASSR